MIESIGLGMAATYLGAAGYVWKKQKRLVFGMPTVTRRMALGPLGECFEVRNFKLEVSPGIVLEGWRSVPSNGEFSTSVIYSGGRNENVAWTPEMQSYIPNCAIWAFNYRGFGFSSGTACESTAKRDAEVILEHVVKTDGNKKIATIGRSLGTAIALKIAKDSQCEKMVLISPFESIRSVVSNRLLVKPVVWLINQNFECTNDAKDVLAHSLVILARNDQSVSNETSARLAYHLGNLRAIKIVNGTTHQTLPRHAETQSLISRFLG